MACRKSLMKPSHRRNRMGELLHRLAHLLGLTTGTVETWWDGNKLMVGFKCSGCGLVSGTHESITTRGREKQND